MKLYKPTTISLTLMVASMILLAAFQVFWLYKEYMEQKIILQKEADILFKNTIQALEDSLIQKKIKLSTKKPLKLNIDSGAVGISTKVSVNFSSTANPTKRTHKKVALEPSSNDSVVVGHLGQLLQQQLRDSFIAFQKTSLANIDPKNIESIRIHRGNPIDFTRVKLKDTAAAPYPQVVIVQRAIEHDSAQKLVGKVARVMLYLRDAKDSIRGNVRFSKSDKLQLSIINDSLALLPKQEKGAPKSKSRHVENNFVIRFDADSLKIPEIQVQYKGLIQKSKIEVPFRVVRQGKALAGDTTFLPHELLTSEVASTMPLGSTYRAAFKGYEVFLLKKIVPQALFSVFLLTITTLAFGAIYRNLRQQRRLTALKNDFISNVTHELKTPIATVSVAIEALQNFGAAQNPQLTKEYLEISKNELNRLTLLVDKVLKMATFEQQGLTLTREELEMKELVGQIMDSMKLQFEKCGATVDYQTSGENFAFWGDKIHLTNVVYNLLDNAIKYSENKPQLKLYLTENESQISFSVSDEGIGIPADYQSKIFEKFFRVPTGNTHNVKGYGLGLSYVASVVKEHGGSINLKSEEGKGSVFVITLPRKSVLKNNG